MEEGSRKQRTWVKVSDVLQTVLERRARETFEVLLLCLDDLHNFERFYHSPGLLSIAAVLKEAGFSVKYIGTRDLFFLSPREVAERLRSFSPKLAGFYTTYHNIDMVQRMAEKMKTLLPQIKVMVGGPTATFEAERMLDFPFIDLVVIGEGEYTVEKLARYFLRGEGKLEDINGIAFRGSRGVVKTAPAAPIEDLDRLPPVDYSMAGIRGSFMYVGGRGCPYHCSFCFQEVHGHRYRFHSAERLVQDVTRNIEAHGCRTIHFMDDTFIAHPERTREICRRLIEYRKKNSDFIFFCQGRVDIFDRHPELLEILKEAGMARLELGIESGDQRVLDAYRKSITIDQTERVLSRIGRIGGISVYGSFIVGGPHETEQTFQNTLGLARRLIRLAPGEFECDISFLNPYPGTQIGQDPKRFGLRVIREDRIDGPVYKGCQVETDSLDRYRIRAMHRKFQQEILREMRIIAPKLTAYQLEPHYRWALGYDMHTTWYSAILSPGAPVLAAWFVARTSGRFRSLSEIPPAEIKGWFPFRFFEVPTYSPNGRFVEIEGYFKKVRLSDPVEILIYEQSHGKASIGQIAEMIRRSRCPDSPKEVILTRIMLPLYRKLERNYQIIFHQPV